MPINTRELMQALAVLADERNIRVTVVESGKGALLCGACCFVGGILLGPAGLALGGLAGGVAAYKTSGNFRPLADVILNDLTDTQREMLVQHVTVAVNDISPTDLALLLPLVLNNSSIQEAVMRTVVSFITNEMKMTIAN